MSTMSAMSSSFVDPSISSQRPGMRRKSSAQNILSSFKSQSSQPPPPAPTVSNNNNTIIYNPQPAPLTTPVATTTPLAREWDAQSLHSDSAHAQPTSQGTSVEYLRDLVQKRIITLTYIRSVHEGRSHWFHTVLVSRQELDREFNNTEMKKRTPRFAILGMSLANLLDIQQPQDLLRGLINTLAEYDQSREESENKSMAKMRQPKRLFRTKPLSKRPGVVGVGFPEYTTNASSAGTEYSDILLSPQIPFPLDYHQVLMSFIDVLSEVYNKISRLLGPSPFPHQLHMTGPLGLLAPLPGVSYIFPDGEPEGSGNSLWGVANANSVNATAVPVMYGGGLASPPPSWTPGFGEMVLKVDGKFKKIISTLLKELDQFARNAIKDELASLDPVLRNLSIADETLGKSSMGYEME